MRLWTIICAFNKYRLDEFLPNIWAIKVFNLLFFWNRKSKNDKAVSLRLFLEKLGPVYIKLGQLASVRRDLIPEYIAEELSLLQDSVPPMAWDEVDLILKDALGIDYQNLFKSIEKESLAAASIAQVHLAVKPNNEKCAVKILRPNLSQIIQKDIKLATKLAKLLEKIFKSSKRLKLLTIIEDYNRVIHDELDLSKEAANMSQVKRNFQGDDRLYVPKVDWQRSVDTVLTMELISGIQVDDISLLHKLGVDMKELSRRGVEIFFTQVFKHNFFHADMHPGNIFIDASNPKKPKYVAVDFGIMGALSEDDQYYLAVLLMSFFNSDYKTLSKTYIDAGWINKKVSAIELESTFRTILEPFTGKPISEISLAKILLKLFKISEELGMEIQPQLVLLYKTLLYVEGLGKQLDPNLDLLTTAKPFIENWLKNRIGIKGFIKKSKDNFTEFLSNAPETSIKIHQILEKATNGELSFQQNNTKLNQSLELIQKNQKSLNKTILSGSGLLSSVLLFGQNQPIFAGVVLGISALLYLKK